MPIDSRHPLYDKNLPAWQRCRATFNGEDDVKAAGQDYLPKPGGLSDKEYEHYTQRALFYEALGRTISGFVGAIARKDPTVVIPPKFEVVTDDVTADGLNLSELSKRLCSEAILQGRLGILVDYDAEADRAYLTTYTVETITNWQDDRIILAETVYEPDPEDKFKLVAIDQYRQLWLDDGKYTVTVGRKVKTEGMVIPEWIPYETSVPSRRGKPIDKIPFFWLTPLGKTSRIEKPPLLGLVNVCLSHYRNSADLEWGRHFTGLPTLYITGIGDPDTVVNVGSTSAILLQNPDSKAGYVEFTGQGLSSLENALDGKEKMMAVLGASVFSQEKNGVEAEGTARIRKSGETNLLMGVVCSVEETLEAALTFAAEWMGISGKIEVTLNREFIDTKLDGPELTALVQAYQAGALSLPQFLYNLQQGEMLAPDTDIEEEAVIVEAAKAKADADAAKLALASKPKLTPKA
jgi:hypothetical protein